MPEVWSATMVLSAFIMADFPDRKRNCVIIGLTKHVSHLIFCQYDCLHTLPLPLVAVLLYSEVDVSLKLYLGKHRTHAWE